MFTVSYCQFHRKNLQSRRRLYILKNVCRQDASAQEEYQFQCCYWLFPVFLVISVFSFSLSFTIILWVKTVPEIKLVNKRYCGVKVRTGGINQTDSKIRELKNKITMFKTFQSNSVVNNWNLVIPQTLPRK